MSDILKDFESAEHFIEHIYHIVATRVNVAFQQVDARFKVIEEKLGIVHVYASPAPVEPVTAPEAIQPAPVTNAPKE